MKKASLALLCAGLLALAPPVTAAPAPIPANVAIVFIAGYGTRYPSPDAIFANVQSRLTAQGWRTAQFLTFSYTGGNMRSGVWVPNAYDCADTGEGIRAATEQLRSMLRQFLAGNPNTSFVLVGHSLGGNIAMAHAVGVAQAGDPLLGVTGIVTVDSPLLGVSSGKSFSLALSCSTLGDQTTRDLTALYWNWPRQLDEDTATVALAGRQGLKIETIGNQNDCLYWENNRGCFDLGSTWHDDRFSQYIPAVQTQYSVPLDPRWGNGLARNNASHFAILESSPYDAYLASAITCLASR